MINDVYNLFLKVVETGSISKAANELFISQPALSQQLKKLEKEFNAKLFTRSNKGIELTKEGRIVYKYFSMFEECLDEMREEIEDAKNNSMKIKISKTLLLKKSRFSPKLHLQKLNRAIPKLNRDSIYQGW